jgi:predicted dehydrogenase
MLKIGVIGCGGIANGLYLPTLNQPRKGFVLQAVCDAVPERAEQAKAEFGARECYANYQEMLEKSDLDQVFILTQLLHHASIVKDCLHAGVHVYTEKPLSPTYQEAKSLLKLADQTGLLLAAAPPLMVFHEYQYLRSLLQKGAVGKVCFVRAHSSHGGPESWPSFTDTGNYYREEIATKIPPIFDMAVYALTILTAMLGPVRRVSAMSGTAIEERRFDKIQGTKPYTMRPKVHDNCMMLLEWEGACFGAVDGSFCMRHNKAPGMEFYGSEGTLYVGSESMSLEIQSTAKGFKRPAEWHDLRIPAGRPKSNDGWGGVIAAHLAECITQGKQPIFGGAHAVHVVEVMEAVFTSSQTGQMVKLKSSF